MKRPTLPTSWRCTVALAATLSLCSLSDAHAQGDGPPPSGTSRGENFSAKPPAQLFASDCTGAGCHKSPQGLNKGQGFGGLAGFLREHYTNSRESAAALAAYLSKLPSGPEPRDARTPRSGKPVAAAPTQLPPGWDEGLVPSRTRERDPSAKPGTAPGTTPGSVPAPSEARAPRQTPAGRTSRASVRPEDDPAAGPAVRSPGANEPAEPAAKPDEAAPNPAARAQRVRHPNGATAAAPSPEPEATPAAAPASPPAPPAPKDFDIFD